MERMRISLPADQREKIEKELDVLCAESTKREWARHDLQKAVGVINWAISFNPLLKPGIHSLVRSLKLEAHERDLEAESTPPPSPGRNSKSNRKIFITDEIREELKWLKFPWATPVGVSFSPKSSGVSQSMKMIVRSCNDTDQISFWSSTHAKGSITSWN